MFTKKRTFVAMAAAASLVLTGCGASNEGGGDEGDSGGGSAAESEWADCTIAEDAAPVADAGEDSEKSVSMVAFNGWDESFATTYLLKNILEADGYTVEVQELDAGPGYTAVASGDIDIVTDTWLPVTHADYLEQYGDDMESLGCWYDNAALTITVNADSPAQTIGDLAEMADEYNNTIVGIEAGAGLTKVTEEEAIPTYGLDDMEFTTSSTAAMLGAIEGAEQKGENVAVTLWHPHWAYAAYDLRDLEDPEGAMGDAEIIYTFATAGFSDEHPYASQLVKNFAIDDEQLASLEDLMVNTYANENPEAAVADWLTANPEFADQLRNGELV